MPPSTPSTTSSPSLLGLLAACRDHSVMRAPTTQSRRLRWCVGPHVVSCWCLAGDLAVRFLQAVPARLHSFPLSPLHAASGNIPRPHRAPLLEGSCRCGARLQLALRCSFLAVDALRRLCVDVQRHQQPRPHGLYPDPHMYRAALPALRRCGGITRCLCGLLVTRRPLFGSSPGLCHPSGPGHVVAALL